MAVQTMTVHNETITQLKVPLPYSLRWVNGYIVRGREGVTIIDPGLHTAEAEAAWLHAMKEQGLALRDVSDIVLTHHHPDHYGLAGWMQAQSGAPVWLSPVGCEQARLLWGPGQPMTEAVLAMFRSHGLDDGLLAPLREHMDGFVPLVSPQPRVSLLEPGAKVRLGSREYVALSTPGHAAGHLVFYDEAERVMFCGDHVLPQITPNVSYFPGGVDDDPLASFLRSLEEIGRLPVAKAYPGHRDPFERFAERTAEIVRHHHERIGQIRSLLAAPTTGYAVCRALFGDRLTLHQLRFALSETLAHLVYMQRQGLAEAVETEPGKTAFRAL